MCSETTNYSPLMMRNVEQININHNLSIYIPYIPVNHASEEYIKFIFKTLNIAIISRVDFLDHKNCIDKMAFIHIKLWHTNIIVEHLQEKILDQNQEARIVYDDPYYWILLPNKRPIPENYAVHLYNLEKSVSELNQSMIEKISNLETSVKEMQCYLNNNDNDNDNDNDNRNLFVNNSCCGAVSGAWNPSGEPTINNNVSPLANQ